MHGHHPRCRRMQDHLLRCSASLYNIGKGAQKKVSFLLWDLHQGVLLVVRWIIWNSNAILASSPVEPQELAEKVENGVEKRLNEPRHFHLQNQIHSWIINAKLTFQISDKTRTKYAFNKCKSEFIFLSLFSRKFLWIMWNFLREKKMYVTEKRRKLSALLQIDKKHN